MGTSISVEGSEGGIGDRKKLEVNDENRQKTAQTDGEASNINGNGGSGGHGLVIGYEGRGGGELSRAHCASTYPSGVARRRRWRATQNGRCEEIVGENGVKKSSRGADFKMGELRAEAKNGVWSGVLRRS